RVRHRRRARQVSLHPRVPQAARAQHHTRAAGVGGVSARSPRRGVRRLGRRGLVSHRHPPGGRGRCRCVVSHVAIPDPPRRPHPDPRTQPDRRREEPRDHSHHERLLSSASRRVEHRRGRGNARRLLARERSRRCRRVPRSHVAACVPAPTRGGWRTALLVRGRVCRRSALRRAPDGRGERRDHRRARQPRGGGRQAAMNIVGTRTLGHALTDKTARFPDRPFLCFEDADGVVSPWLSWRELDRLVNRAAHFLVRRGPTPGEKFNIHLGNCPEFLVFWLAAARTGAVMVPTTPASTAEEMAYILAHSEARLAVTEPRYAEACRAVRDRCPALLDVLDVRPLEPLLAGLPDTPPPIAVTSRDEVSMQYTSGTTSRPKGVLLTHANYLYGGEAMAKAMGVGRDDRRVLVLPLFHAGAQLHAFVPMLLVGGSVAVMERFSASRFIEQASRHEATLAALFAAPIRMLLSHRPSPVDGKTRLRAVSYAPNTTVQQFEAWPARSRAPLMQIWGMTETMSLPLLQPLDLPRKPLSMGMPVLGYECKVVDEAGRDVPPGTVGELIVRGEP